MKTSKKLFSLLASLLYAGLLIVSSACSKGDDGAAAYVCATCSDTPEGLAANDFSVKGVYKGSLVGSTGSIYINIQNGSNTITATMVIDGVSTLLTSTVEVIDGESYVAPFTGTFNGSPVSITFHVGIGGLNPTMVSSDIPGHPNMVFMLFKETSTSLIEAFEGEIVAPGETGTFNIVVARSISKWGYIVQTGGSEPADTGSGTMSGNDLLTEGDNVGTITGDEIQGSFLNDNNETIVVSGRRTL